MILTAPAIHAKQLNKQPDGTYTATVGNPTAWPKPLLCQNPDRPAQTGDVYSVTPQGDVITRPAGNAGAWEKFTIRDTFCVFAPLGENGPAYLLPYVADIPHV